MEELLHELPAMQWPGLSEHSIVDIEMVICLYSKIRVFGHSEI
jgi:hypothetical protein